MEAWLSQYFINSSLIAGGALLLGVPIVIHLINRLRFRRVKFAAMEFLLQSQKKNRRRVLLEQILLLLLRLAAVAAVVALIARPMLPKDLPLFGGVEIQHVVLIDDSGSMGERLGDKTAFDAAKEVAADIAAEAERRPEVHKLTLMLASKPTDPIFASENLDSEFLAELSTRLESLSCSHRHLNMVDAVEAAKTHLLDQKGAVWNFHLLSDFRDADWADDAALATALHEMADAGISTNLAKTVAEPTGNLAVTELGGQLQVAAVDIPLRLSVKVKNFGEKLVENVRIALYVDGTKLPRNLLILKLEAGETASLEFDVEFPAPGAHDVRAVVIGSEDTLEADNARYLAVDVAESHEILVIDGNPDRAAARYLQDALEPAPGITGYDVVAEDAEYLRRHPLGRFRNIVLVNIPQLPADSVKFLEDYVAAGGGVAWFMGDQVKPELYNEMLHRGGEGVFPVPLNYVAELSEDLGESTSDFEFEPHPLFAAFEGQDNPFLSNVRVTRYFDVGESFEPGPQTRVIGRLRNRAPAFVEHRFGNGRVVTFLSSCGPSWNNWPQNPSFVILQLELQKYLAEATESQPGRITGTPIRVAVDYTTDEEVRVQIPREGGGEMIRTRLQPVGAEDDGAETLERTNAEFTHADTDLPGIYMVTLVHRDNTDEAERLTYNYPVAEESDLSLAATESIRSRIGSDVLVHVHDVGETGWIDGEEAGQELRNWLLGLLLLILFAEQLLAMRLSFHNRGSGSAAERSGTASSPNSPAPVRPRRVPA